MNFESLKGIEISIKVTESGFPYWSANKDNACIILGDESVCEVSRLFGYLFYCSKIDAIITEMLDKPFNLESFK